MKSSYERINGKSVDLGKLATLKFNIEALNGKIGEGDNMGWENYYAEFNSNKRLCLNLIDFPSDVPQIGVIAQNLNTILNLAWAIQLISTKEADEICAAIWRLCGEIAADLQD